MNALVLAVAAATTLAVAPWTGANYPTASHAQATYRLSVRSTSHGMVHLYAQGVASGWIAAFCTKRVCSPMQVNVDLTSASEAVLQLELIKVDEDAGHASGATIRSDDGASIVIPPKS